jgi:hypothetical protein
VTLLLLQPAAVAVATVAAVEMAKAAHSATISSGKAIQFCLSPSSCCHLA